MWSKLLYGLFLVVLLLSSVKLTHFLMKKIKLNRWIIGLSAFLILIIPNVLFDNIPSIISNILSIIFAILCIMFFEISRNMLEKGEYKGIVKNNKSNNKNNSSKKNTRK